MIENGYTPIEDTTPEVRPDKATLVREAFAHRRPRQPFATTAETLEQLTVTEPDAEEVPPEPPSMERLREALAGGAALEQNGNTKIEVRVSVAEKEAWMSHAYRREMNLSELVRRTMNELVGSDAD